MLKKTASKPLPPNYIAIDDTHEQVIAIGPRETILEIVQDYCNDEGWDEDDIQISITIYELGKHVDFDVETNIKIHF